MSHTWTISAGGRLYGPYTAERMQSFVVEGRLAPHSLIARDDSEVHAPAQSDPEIALLFKQPEPSEKEAEAPAPSQPHSENSTPVQESVQSRFGRSETDTPGNGPSRFLVMADMRSNSLTGLEHEIHSLGLACMLVPQTWLLTSELSISEVRNRLVQKLGKLDTFFVVDASNNKAAWFNFGPEFEARIRSIWQKGHEQPARRAG